MGKLPPRRAARLAEARAYREEKRVLYQCPACGRHTVTVTIDEGKITPLINCQATPGCNGHAVSLGLPEPWPADVPEAPGWEWYRPDHDEFVKLREGGDATATQAEYLRTGGLLLRARTGPR